MKVLEGVFMLKKVEQNDKGEYKCTATTTSNRIASAVMTLSVTGVSIMT